MVQEPPKDAILSGLGAEWPQDLLPEIRAQVAAAERQVVVLDDDPTGTQTVHGVPVLTHWSVEALRAELATGGPGFYLLTNSRSLPVAEAQALNREIGRNLVQAGREAGRRFTVVSRSDSTLRGHFPAEVEALAEALGGGFDAWLLIPFFLEGGRYTIDDVHYVAEGERLIPAGQTEFARDAAFGYRASDLRQWVEEKTAGRVRADEVASISLSELRRGRPAAVAARLQALSRGAIGVVNAASYRDLEVLTLGLLAAEARGRRFLCRTAASFVRVRLGLAPQPLLTPAQLALPDSGGGLIVVGSYVPRTSAQLQPLLARPGVLGIEVSVERLLAGATGEVERVAGQATQALARGTDVVVYTSRRYVAGEDAGRSLAIGSRVSACLVAIVRAISTRPRYILAKGGITSSDLATGGLDVRRALVLGQILPGVPVWRLGSESRWPGLAYIVFPGNVGGPQALAEILDSLRSAP